MVVIWTDCPAEASGRWEWPPRGERGVGSAGSFHPWIHVSGVVAIGLSLSYVITASGNRAPKRSRHPATDAAGIESNQPREPFHIPATAS